MSSAANQSSRTASLVLEPCQCEGGQPTYGADDEVEFLVRQQGNDAYKSLMRQELFHYPILTGRADERNQFQRDSNLRHVDSPYNNSNSTAAELSQLYGSSADPESLLSTFSDLKNSLNGALNRDVGEEYVLFTYPMYLPKSARDRLREQIDAAGFTTLPMQPLPIIATKAISDVSFGGDTILWIELGGAAFEMALLDIDAGVVETLAYEARLDLGEDVVALRIIKQETNGALIDFLDTTTIAAVKLELQELQRELYKATVFKAPHADLPRLSALAKLREERSLHIYQVFERFMTDVVQKWPHLAGRLPDHMQISSPGDHYWSDFAALNEVIPSVAKVSNLHLKVLVDGDAHPWHRASRNAALWGKDFEIFNVPGKEHFKGRDHADWYKRRSEAVARYRCERRGGTPVGRYTWDGRTPIWAETKDHKINENETLWNLTISHTISRNSSMEATHGNAFYRL